MAESSATGHGSLKRTLGSGNLIALGIGAIIGAGLFVRTAAASAEHAGPSVTIAFIVAAIGCAFAGLCYAEFASMIPIAGSAYTYSYATMGELIAWIIGWDLVLEYALGAATVSIAWSEYLNKLLVDIGGDGWAIPYALSHSPFEVSSTGVNGIINLPALFILAVLTAVLIRGTKESALVNGIIVIVKVAVVLVFIAVGWSYIKPANHEPYIPPSGFYKEEVMKPAKGQETLDFSITINSLTDSSARLTSFRSDTLVQMGTDVKVQGWNPATKTGDVNLTAAAFAAAINAHVARSADFIATATGNVVKITGTLAGTDFKAMKVILSATKGVDFTLGKANRNPFGGLMGILAGAGMVFFAFIGFDAVSTAAQEAKKPSRDMPIGILVSLFICTVLYILFAHVLTGVSNYEEFRVAGKEASVSFAIDHYMKGYQWLSTAVTVAILAGFSSVILVMLLGQSRVFFSMSRDGLVPQIFSAVHPKFKTPYKSNLVFLAFVGLFAAFVPGSVAGDMTSIGTLFAFVLVCIGVFVMRRTHPNAPRPFKVPFYWVICGLGVVVCGAMIAGLGPENWIRLLIWMAIGFVIYFAYGKRNSRLNKKQ